MVFEQGSALCTAPLAVQSTNANWASHAPSSAPSGTIKKRYLNTPAWAARRPPLPSKHSKHITTSVPFVSNVPATHLRGQRGIHHHNTQNTSVPFVPNISATHLRGQRGVHLPCRRRRRGRLLPRPLQQLRGHLAHGGSGGLHHHQQRTRHGGHEQAVHRAALQGEGGRQCSLDIDID